MPNRTYIQLQTALASMWGYESVTDLLDQDLVDIKSFLNAAYFDCFAPQDGTRAHWPTEYVSGILKAPVNATLGLTQGSKVVTGYAFEDTYAGSFVKIGDRFFRYSKKVTVTTPAPATTYYLVQPWDQDSGDYEAIVYHNAYALPWNVIEIPSMPNIIGLGILAPLPDADTELMLRTEPVFDFNSRGGREPFAIQRNTFRQSAYYDVGDPRYYHIDQASIGFTFGLGNRIHVYPLPDRVLTFELRANVVPDALEDDATVAEMPAQAIDNILLPIAREYLALNTGGRRYTGPNVTLLSKAADRARAQLKGLRRVQVNVANYVRLAKGW